MKSDVFVLVHGLLGWGDYKKNTLRYFGGKKYDFIRYFEKNTSYKLFAPEVGPISSNWERACELYAAIKGGKVDFGEYHAKKFNISRYGKEYPGLYPQWDENHPIHFIGHSQGGQTIRMLSRLLAFGSKKEMENSANNTSPLFIGDKSEWIKSISTLSTPHDGSTYCVKGNKQITPIIIKKLYNLKTKLNSNKYKRLSKYHLEHFLTKKDDQYAINMSKDQIFNNLSSYDLSTEGAANLNRYMIENPNAYHFAYSFKISKQRKNSPQHYVRFRDSKMFFYTGHYVGKEAMIYDDKFNISINDTYVNDGIVNLSSQNGPKLGRDYLNIKTFSDIKHLEKGVWYDMGCQIGDHNTSIGQTRCNKFDAIAFWDKMLKMLAKLD